MAKIEIYTTPICPYCVRAKALLNKKGVKYQEFNVMTDRAKRTEMEKRSGGHTVPQIFIDDKPIGGCDDLFELDFDGELNGMLGLA
ncbi:glutaredoxin 3 [Magnetovibrio blakemorei]|uniref:Glutaredoxin n=1 Tax=Magnetovibrio blakemorei TaxID=28181 RepID=A0A1E5Q6T5_9PROT|nr:glutaredoxin 3 [Magnetovibrio blakemorei]OEJ66727.1 glutaredoxin 3 [Magnetovibrio blakemorei]